LPHPSTSLVTSMPLRPSARRSIALTLRDGRL
jgi:hypothetical protein